MYEKLDSIKMEIEAILDWRPPIPLSNDPKDMASLTPGQLLMGETSNTVTSQNEIKIMEMVEQGVSQ